MLFITFLTVIKSQMITLLASQYYCIFSTETTNSRTIINQWEIVSKLQNCSFIREWWEQYGQGKKGCWVLEGWGELLIENNLKEAISHRVQTTQSEENNFYCLWISWSGEHWNMSREKESCWGSCLEKANESSSICN